MSAIIVGAIVITFASVPSVLLLALAVKGKEIGETLARIVKNVQLIQFIVQHKKAVYAVSALGLYLPYRVFSLRLYEEPNVTNMIYRFGITSLRTTLAQRIGTSSAKALVESELTPILKSELWIIRATKEFDIIRRALDGPFLPNKYFVIGGPQGCGKSVAVACLIKARKCTIYLKVTDACTSPSALVSQLWDECQFPVAATPKHEDLLAGFDLLRDKKMVPCVVFDVDGRQDTQKLDSARSLAKTLLGHAVSIIVLSGHISVLAFGSDREREQIVWMEDFSETECHTFLKRAQVIDKLSKEQCREFIDIFGTRAVELRSLVDAINLEVPFSEYVESKKAEAEMCLRKFPLKSILRELKQHPDGVSIDLFGGQIEEDVHIAVVEDVAQKVMASYDVIYYDTSSASYKLSRPSLKYALERMTI
jgi:hypothetical protein